MSDRKTLNINPDLFSFSNNTSKKNRSKNNSNSNGIKIKTNTAKKKDDTLKKRSILKMIRQHQEDRYKKIFEENKTTKKSEPTPSENKFNKEFQDAKAFLENLTEKKNEEQKLKNHTLRQYPNNSTNSMLFSNAIEPLTPIDDIITMNTPPIHINTISPPKYGCLKNGSLPTYRNYMNQTRKNISQPTIIVGGNTINNSLSPIASQNATNKVKPSNPMTQSLIMGGAKEPVENKINESFERVKHMNQTAIKLQELKKQVLPKKFKRKKTKRRTYKIGKSKVLPKISVLVSNRTIRNNITTKKQLLRQVRIQEVKSYLMKRGFIKVGSTAPNDVLRKMYESAVMICGEVQNHNPENLLYNYLNGGDT